jgi:hypothetical protein
MSKSILIEEFHVSVFVPRNLPDAECVRIRRTLNGKSFGDRLRPAIQGVVRRYPVLSKIRITLTQ